MSKHTHNFHGHTYLCGHATGTAKDYVIKAIEHNYTHLGISEHAPMPNLHSINTRLSFDDYDLYFSLLKEASDLAVKHNIKFYKGFEIEYFKDLDVYERYLKDVDYLILGQHYIVKNGELKSTYALDSLEDIIIYQQTIIDAMHTGYFNLVCHPDLCFYNIKNPTDAMYEALRPLIKVAKDLDIPLEFNANGIRKALRDDKKEDIASFRYPRERFFQMVKAEGAKVMISSDCHSPENLHDWAIDKSNQIAEEMGLDLVTYLKI